MENIPVWMYPDRDPDPPETSGMSDDNDDVIICDICGEDIYKGDTYYGFDNMFLNIDTVCTKCVGTFLNNFKRDSERVNE